MPILKEESTEICMQRNSCRNLAQNEPELAVSKLNPCMRGHIQSSNSYDECDSIASPYSQFNDNQYPMNNDGSDNINIYQSPMPAWVETEPHVIFWFFKLFYVLLIKHLNISEVANFHNFC